MNAFIVVFGTIEQFTLQRSQEITANFSADHVIQAPIFSRAHLAQAVGDLEDQGVDSSMTVLLVTDTTLCLKSLVSLQRTFPELVGAYHIENLSVNIIPRPVSVGYIASVHGPRPESVLDLLSGQFIHQRFEVTA